MIQVREKFHDGYSLIECLVYCGIVGFFITAFIPIAIRLAGSVSRLEHINHDLISFCVSSDLFYRDLKQHSNHLHIIVTTNDTLIWRCGGQDDCIGWCLLDGNLVRTEGKYLEATKSWQYSKQSIVCNGVIAGLFSVDQSSYPKKILLRLTLRHGKTMERLVLV